jgi:hypothetical protein
MQANPNTHVNEKKKNFTANLIFTRREIFTAWDLAIPGHCVPAYKFF